tara:strand:+ start:8313 stop:9110 length:798 start_codon:yes stop_codon:yes gene_type:complete
MTMTTIALYAFGSVFVVSLVSLIGILVISVRDTLLQKWILVFVALAVGALLGDAFIHLIPEAFEKSANILVTSLLIIGGILLFFILEKFLHWHHWHGHELHEDECLGDKRILDTQRRIRPLGYIILASDGFHNLLDGMIIGASYLVSIEVGIATTLAVILHEIPQEIGDFGVLLHSGFTKAQAILVNFASALLAILGVIVVFVLEDAMGTFSTWMIPIAAGGFIYIAGSDLVPELHKTTRLNRSFVQLLAILVGILAIVALLLIE